MSTQGKPVIRYAVTILAWSTLLAAFIFGKFINKEDHISILENLYETNPIEVIDSGSGVLTVQSDEFPRHSFVRYGSAQGYGGDLLVGVQYDSAGTIQKVHLIKERETTSYVTRLVGKRFFRQFSSKKINDPFVAGSDVDVVSGCTTSSKAFTKAVRDASYLAARIDFNLAVEEPFIPWRITFPDVVLLILLVTAVLSIYFKRKWLRYTALVFSLALLGIHLNASISISHFARLVQGFLPNMKEHSGWWLLVVISLGFPFFLKKNVYCYAVCPFHGVQIALFKISGFRFKIIRSFQRASKTISLSLLWLALIIIFISDNPTLGSYEPFALLFSLEGAALQWYLLPSALIGALFVPDFYCRYFCPVGQTLKIVMNAGTRLRGSIASIFNLKDQDKGMKEHIFNQAEQHAETGLITDPQQNRSKINIWPTALYIISLGLILVFLINAIKESL